MDDEYINLIRDRMNDILFQMFSAMYELTAYQGSMVALDATNDPVLAMKADKIRVLMLKKSAALNSFIYDYDKAIMILNGEGEENESE